MQYTNTMTELTSAETVEIHGGGDCAEFARDVGEFLGTALRLVWCFAEGAEDFDWGTMK